MSKELMYFIDILYDADNHEYCFRTRYRFQTKELVIEFVEYLKNIDKIVVRGIIGESTSYKSNYRFRPKFNNIQLAIQDLECFIKYCYNYDDRPLYEYQESVHRVRLREYELAKISEEIKNESI